MENNTKPTVYGRGFIGRGKYSSSENNKPLKIYQIWRGMMDRCYNKKVQEKHPSYKECHVHPCWYNFQNFGRWFEENYIESWHLDKDILISNNKIYSPETCCFVPREVNELFRSYNKKSDLPVGVHKHGKKYRSKIQTQGITHYIGSFDTVEEAYQSYKEFKGQEIKRLAEKHKYNLSPIVYETMCNCKVGENLELILGGSMAIAYHFPDFNRIPKDVDFFVKEAKQNLKGVEFLLNPLLFKYTTNSILPADLILTLKMSHLFWDINWHKTMWDVQFLLGKGLKYNPEIFEELVEYWMETKPKIRRSNLASAKEDFFTNNINKDVDEHDFLHTLINPVPMYTLLLKDGEEVELDPQKWENLSREDKNKVVQEETMVMAYERYFGKTGFRQGFARQLKDNIIKHFPRYIAVYAILNYPELEKVNFNYFKTINDGRKKD